ncbi:hypothetical protein SAMN05660971_00359 [Halomonas cupida]|uniref:Uncharacterized protein n=1 Tax=Halomonas cupida TaxID=44933 RepID=A0A1M7A511_9GAMM|nr:hypothetical protein SAMN05660971_00359 [Halomonas cupida]
MLRALYLRGHHCAPPAQREIQLRCQADAVRLRMAAAGLHIDIRRLQGEPFRYRARAFQICKSRPRLEGGFPES